MKKVVIHMQPSALDKVEELGLNWDYSKQHGLEEIDVVVADVEFDSLTEDPDVLLVDYYNLDYDQVNCIEALNFCAI